ncbi:MAG: hypothetical protein U9Q90_02645 [Campylobacterota bacterium]|nr:hypothetical protein [Campylobacterota bacterium]
MKKIILGLGILGFIGCAQNNTMDLEGRLSVKGTSVHTYLTIEDQKSHKSYKIQNQESFDLIKRQNQTVKVKAKLIKKAVGPGFPAVIEVLEIE